MLCFFPLIIAKQECSWYSRSPLVLKESEEASGVMPGPFLACFSLCLWRNWTGVDGHGEVCWTASDLCPSSYGCGIPENMTQKREEGIIQAHTCFSMPLAFSAFNVLLFSPQTFPSLPFLLQQAIAPWNGSEHPSFEVLPVLSDTSACTPAVHWAQITCHLLKISPPQSLLLKLNSQFPV